MKRKVFYLVPDGAPSVRLAGDVGAVWAHVDGAVGGGSTIRPLREQVGVWTVFDREMREVGALIEGGE